VSRRPHMTGFTLVRQGHAGVDAVHFDVFDGISYVGLELCPPAVLYAESSVRDGVRALSARGRALATVVQHLAWNGYLSKEKYRDELAEVLANPADGPWMRRRVGEVFGVPSCWAVVCMWRGGRLTESEPRRRRLVNGRDRRCGLLARSGDFGGGLLLSGEDGGAGFRGPFR
jgi:hypothetical protein